MDIDMKTAPRDGTWVLLEGEFAGGGTSSWRLGRYLPDDTGEYEWQTLDSEYTLLDLTVDIDDAWSWYPEGRVYGWMPLP